VWRNAGGEGNAASSLADEAFVERVRRSCASASVKPDQSQQLQMIWLLVIDGAVTRTDEATSRSA